MVEHQRNYRTTVTLTAWLIAAAASAVACVEPTDPAETRDYSLEAITDTVLSGIVGAEVHPAPAVRVLDPSGAPAPGVIVSFHVIGDGVLQASSATTDGTGIARTVWSLGTTAGSSKLVASVSGVPDITFRAVGLPGPAASMLRVGLSADGRGFAGERARAPTVRITDAFGNPVSNVPVTFAVVGGGGWLSRGAAVTSNQGVASAGSWTLGEEGFNVAIASSSGVTAVQFVIIAEPAAQIVYELDSVSLGGSSLTGRIAFRSDGQFTTHVDGIVGFGAWEIGNFTSISFTYSDLFLEELRDSLDFLPAALDGLANRREVATIVGDAIVLQRCFGEDCYDSYWMFSRVAGSPLAAARP